MKATARHIIALFILLPFIATGCQKESSSEQDPYGYLQISLTKEMTRGMVEGNSLEHLSLARKIRIALEYNGAVIEQTLNLKSVSEQAAEFGLTTQEIKLLKGKYRLLSYALYGEYRNSGDMAPVLQAIQIEGGHELTVNEGCLTIHNLEIPARKYGRFSAGIVRLEPQTKAGPTYSEFFEYSDIDSVKMVLKRTAGSVSYSHDIKVKAHRGSSDAPVFNTDTVDIQSGDYTITHIELFNRRGQFMYAQDTDISFCVEHFELTRSQVGIQLPQTQGTLDGIALRQIWESMDGPSWRFHDQGAYNSNWVFTMSDGSPRPVSAWVKQPGVTVNSDGRVIGLNLGAFNPMGEVPDAIGQLTALERLYLGEHTDEVYYTLEGVGGITYSMTPSQMARVTDTRLHRVDIARERSRLRQLREQGSHSTLLLDGQLHEDRTVQSFKYAQETVQTGSFDPANRITGISPEIGKLTNLTELYIANSLITKLPKELALLTGITDLELYNNPFTELDGEIFKGMKDLASVNIDRLFNLTQDQILAAADKMCDYCPRIQLLYMCNLGLTRLPDKLNRLTDLRLLDVSHNRIDTIGSLLPMAPIQVILNHNRLKSIPADLCITDDIEMFTCTDNLLEQFPAILSNLGGMYSFENVDLSGNHMHGFQPGFSGIRTEKLIMAANYMGHLPGESGGEFPMEFAITGSVINYLDLSYNNIDTIRNSALRGIDGLKALDISKNYLRTIPSAFSSQYLPWLTGLDASHNQFDGFPANVLNVSSLQQLLLADQGYYSNPEQTRWVRTMTEWPSYMHLHGSLTKVDVSGNDFRIVTNFPENLTTLDVRDNPNIRMTIPSYIAYKIRQGLYVLLCDESQDITEE